MREVYSYAAGFASSLLSLLHTHSLRCGLEECRQLCWLRGQNCAFSRNSLASTAQKPGENALILHGLSKHPRDSSTRPPSCVGRLRSE